MTFTGKRLFLRDVEAIGKITAHSLEPLAVSELTVCQLQFLQVFVREDALTFVLYANHILFRVARLASGRFEHVHLDRPEPELTVPIATN